MGIKELFQDNFVICPTLVPPFLNLYGLAEHYCPHASVQADAFLSTL